jgi:ABC-type branched-subunit amino acid transport system permease subunit
MQRLTGIITWIIQATWYTNTPNPSPLTEAIWLIMVIGGAGLIFGPRIKQP